MRRNSERRSEFSTKTATGRTTYWGGSGVCSSPLFENVSLVIRPNLHRYSQGWTWVIRQYI